MFMASPEPGKALQKLTTTLAKRKRKPTLDELAQLIRESHAECEAHGAVARSVARIAIERALECGSYLREAKLRPELKAKFEVWVKKETGLSARTAYKYRHLHKWISTHPNREQLLSDRSMTLRRLYLLAGIIPDDEMKEHHEIKDELAKLRRLFWKAQIEAAACLGYAEPEKLLAILEPTIELAAQLRVALNAKNRNHGSDF